MKRLARLCAAVRALTPEAQIIFNGVAADEEAWVVRVRIADVILVETAAGPLNKVVGEAAQKITGLSQRVLAAAQPQDESDSSIPPPKERT